MKKYSPPKSKSNNPKIVPGSHFNQRTREPDSQTANNHDSQDSQTSRHPGKPQTTTDIQFISREEVSTSLQSGTERENHQGVEEKWRALFESGRYHDMPLLAYVRLAYERSIQNTWEKNRKSSTWEFLRYLKARVEFDDLEPEEALSDILFM